MNAWRGALRQHSSTCERTTEDLEELKPNQQEWAVNQLTQAIAVTSQQLQHLTEHIQGAITAYLSFRFLLLTSLILRHEAFLRKPRVTCALSRYLCSPSQMMPGHMVLSAVSWS
ncbi:hypothetical protein J6590_034821 [Homalodisca vitripennis]|nr:hypothetical protein J6590_034821 [Homalodisca vitripennis]